MKEKNEKFPISISDKDSEKNEEGSFFENELINPKFDENI